MNIKHLAVVLPALTFAATADAAIEDAINSYDILEAASFQQPNLTGIATLPKPSVDLFLGNTDQTVHAFVGPTRLP